MSVDNGWIASLDLTPNSARALADRAHAAGLINFRTLGGVPRELIAEAFGQDVASLVEEVTDDKSLPKAARKDKQVKTAATNSSRAKILKLADKVSNLRAIAASAPSDWSVKRRLEYVRWAKEVANGLRGINRKLEEQFDDAAAAAERSFKPAI
jgi:(p)ppGpp synthase/HD superfamily hydrolase